MISTTFLALAILSQPAPVPLSYWLAECNAWPLSKAQLADDGIRVAAVHKRPGRISVRLTHPATGRRAHLAAHRLGSRETGWSVWSIRGPASIGRAMANSPACRVVATYTQAMSWPAAAKAWIMDRAVCYGSATWRGRAFKDWPCQWVSERAGQGTVHTLAAIGPGIRAGGNGRRAAGLNQ